MRTLLVPPERRKFFPSMEARHVWEVLPRRGELLRWGDEATNGYPALPASAYLAYARSGDRRVFETPYFKRRSLLIGAALAECVAGNGMYLDAVIDGLWLVCEESSWVLSAHNGAADGKPGHEKNMPLPDVTNPHIDLFAAQTAATLAHTVALLGGALEAVTPLLCRRVRLEVEKRVLTPFMERDDFWWMGFTRKDLNNWTPWILSNIIDAFLLLETDDDRLAAALTRVMRMLDRYLACQSEDGGCDEGCGYWNMAGASLLDCLESLRLATGEKADFYGEPLIRNIAAFPLKAHIAGEWYWNFADCDAKPMLDGERVYTFGLRTGNPALAALGYQIAVHRMSVIPQDTSQMNRVLYMLFTPLKPMVSQPAADYTVALPVLGVYAFARGYFYAALKGGHNGESHNHNDVGSCILFYRGEPCVVDAGNMVYTAKTFSSERYTLWNTRAAYHNIPLINGVEQREGVNYRATNVTWGENGASMDLQEAYPAEAGLIRYTRGLTMDGEDSVTVEDELTLTAPAPVEWIWLFRPEPTQATAADGQKALCVGDLRMSVEPALTVCVEEIVVTDTRMPRSFPGNLYRVTMAADPAARHHVKFQFLRG
ncbi:MAG: heparinase II/III-family protein [Eubacteriales bacterium]|nr:heparinase II/III-family protein [Eubacteriales bacterium]